MTKNLVISNIFTNFAQFFESMSQILPKYINKKQNVVRLVLWTALYAELFITIYQPFNSRTWISGVSDWQYFLFATLAVLVAMLVVALSRTVMYYVSKKHDISYLDYGIWVAMEVVAMSLIYTSAPYAFLPSHRLEFSFFSLFGDAIIYTTFVLLIPYAIVMMAIILEDRNKLLVQYGLREDRNRDKMGVENMLNFYDNRGELKLSIREDSLYYIESADNYVNIHYYSVGKMQHFMLRNKIRTLEERFKDQELIRCHRSYIVSFPRVRVLKRTEDGLMVDFDRDDVPNIPVSKTYSQRIIDRFTQEARFV